MKISNAPEHRISAVRSHNVLALAALAMLFGSGAFAATGSSVSIADTTRMDPSDAVIGPLPTNQPIHIEVALKPRNKDVLDAFVANIARSDAQHQRPQLMTPEQFLADHAPTTAQAQRVVNYLASMGYTHIVVAPNRLLVSADGTAATARNAFMTTISQVRTQDGRIAYANTNDVRIPSALGDTVLAVVGLQNVHQFGASVRSSAPLQKPSHSASTQDVTVHSAMDYPSIYGATDPVANQVPVGILSEGDLSEAQSSLNAYATASGMKPIVQSIVNTNGSSTDTTFVNSWYEASAMIVSVINGGPEANSGPAASLIFYNVPSLSDSNVTADLNTVVTANQSKIIEASIAQCETDAQADGTASAQDAILEEGFAIGQTFAFPTGDGSAPPITYPSEVSCTQSNNTLGWPASSQYVTAVGGTDLNTVTGNPLQYNFENVWANSTGKPSVFEPMPTWQSTFGVSGTTRGTPDVAFAAHDGADFTGGGGRHMLHRPGGIYILGHLGTRPLGRRHRHRPCKSNHL